MNILRYISKVTKLGCWLSGSIRDTHVAVKLYETARLKLRVRFWSRSFEPGISCDVLLSISAACN